MDENILFKNKRLFVRQAPDTPFTYFERLGVDSIAFLIFKKSPQGVIKLGLIKEFKPSLLERFNREVFLPTAFGGSQDKIDRDSYLSLSDEDRYNFMKSLAITECKEESGFEIKDDSRCYFTGIDFLSSQMNQMVFHFAFDVTDLENTGTVPFNEYEARSEVVWYYPDEFISLVQCAKAKSIYVCLMKKLTEELMAKEASVKTSARVPFEPPLQIRKLLTEKKLAYIKIPSRISSELKEKAREFYKTLASFLESLGYIVLVGTDYNIGSEVHFLLTSENVPENLKFNKKYDLGSTYLLNEVIKSDIINLDLD